MSNAKSLYRVALILPLAAAALLLPCRALAGGFSFPVVGSRGTTTGGFVARADDTTAMYHNPAGLGMLEQYTVDISGTAVLSHTNYTRCTEAAFDANGNPTGCKLGADGEELMEPTVSTVPYGGLPKGFGVLPYLGLAGRFGLKKWNFGIAVYSPHNATGSFQDCERAEDGAPTDCSKAPSRFHAVLGTVNSIFITPAVAVTPIPELHVGFSVSAVRAALTSERALWLGGTAASFLGWNGEGRIRLDASAWTWAAQIGVIWHAGRTIAPGNPWLRGLRLAASYSTQAEIALKSDLSLYSPGLHSLLKENGGCRKGDASKHEVLCATTVDFTFPMQLRFGFNWSITPEWGFGFDATWQDYSQFKEIKVEFDEPLSLAGIVSVNETTEPKNSFDIWTFTMGVNYAPARIPGLEISLGFLIDQSPYPDNTYSLLSPDADKIGPFIGVSYLTSIGLQISAGYVPLFYKDRVVRDSMLTAKICKDGDTKCQAIAPNATFSMNGDVLDKRVDLWTLQIGYRFGAERKGLPY